MTLDSRNVIASPANYQTCSVRWAQNLALECLVYNRDFVADNFAMAMADFGTYPPWAAAWAPFMLFLLVGESVLIRTEE